DQPDQLGVVDVEAEVPVELADGGQVVVERLLDVAAVVLEPPDPVGRGGEDREADEPLHRERAQDQLVAQFPAPAEQRRRRSQTATFSVNRAKRGDGMLLLYPDELTVVNTRSIGTWVYVSVPAAYLAVHFYLFHTIGWGLVAIWYAAGWWIWQALSRRLAARKV